MCTCGQNLDRVSVLTSGQSLVSCKCVIVWTEF